MPFDERVAGEHCGTRADDGDVRDVGRRANRQVGADADRSGAVIPLARTALAHPIERRITGTVFIISFRSFAERPGRHVAVVEPDHLAERDVVAAEHLPEAR